MSTVTVYRWQKYDIATDEVLKSRRWATLEAIERACGEPVDRFGVEVDASELDPDTPSMTPRNWRPPSERYGGFQRQVTT
jgi:hypothetical protein